MVRHIGIRQKFGICALIILGVSRSSLYSCGLDFRLPVGKFGPLTESGAALFAVEVGKIVDGSDEIPIYIRFRSDQEFSSPILGKGWTLPLLESRIIQVAENEFLVEQPNGWRRTFYRTKESKSLLKGQGGWVGEINGNVINLWADCGWRLSYTNGTISSMSTPSGTKLNYIASKSGPTEIRSGGNSLLKVEHEKLEADTLRLKSSSGDFIIRLGDLPVIKQVGGQSVISNISKSLVSFSGGEALKNFTFSYPIDENLQPKMVYSANGVNKSIGWDPASKLLTRDQDWQYSVNYDKDSGSIEVARHNGSKKGDTLSIDRTTGVEIRERTTGERVENHDFMSGILWGKPRLLKISDKNGIKYQKQYFYDESAKLIRIVGKNFSTEVERIRAYHEDGTSTEILKKAGIEKQILLYDEDNNLYATQIPQK